MPLAGSQNAKFASRVKSATNFETNRKKSELMLPMLSLALMFVKWLCIEDQKIQLEFGA